MSSDLYRRALGFLPEAEKVAFGRWVEWLECHVGLLPDEPTRGAKILSNLQAEAHLVGEGSFGDPTELAAFLWRCATLAETESTEERRRGYEATCREFAGRGLKVPREHLPDGLLRYSSSRKLASTLIQRMLGIRAREAFNRETLPPESAFARLRDRWSASRLDATDRLGRGDSVFATFEHPEGAPRHDAVALARALALPLWLRPRTGQEILVELSYPTDAVVDHRFPTCADAGWLHLFSPAPEKAPDGESPASCCGWTKPLSDDPPQPEIVHENAPLQVLSEPPRYLGPIV